MLALLGAMTAAGGLFLFLWYRTLVSLPVGRQPPFIHPASFKWGVPAISVALTILGLVQLAAVTPRFAAVGVFAGALLTFGILRFDRYTADMRGTYELYRKTREANPTSAEIEVLYHTARVRYPKWSHDRVVELVAGKDIEALILLMVVKDYGINPIRDWELYRSLKVKAQRIAKRAVQSDGK